MKIALINPNSTASMTQKALVSALKVVSEGTSVVASNPSDTPKSIEGHYDEAISLPGLLKEVEIARQGGCDGVVVAQLVREQLCDLSTRVAR